MPADPSRRQPPAWRKQASAGAERKASAQPAWRKDAAAPRPTRRFSRRAQFGVAGGLFLVLVAGLAVLIYWLSPPKPACLIVVGSGYEDNLSLPHNVYGWKGARDVADWCGGTVGAAGSYLGRLTGAASIRLQADPRALTDESGWAPANWQHFRESTLIILVALHGGANKADGPFLFLDDPAGQKRLKLAQMIDDLAPITKQKNVVLILDATQVSAHWPAGMLHNDFARQLQELEPKIKAQNRLVVLSASMPDQRSWVSEEWRQTIFTHYLLEGLKGGAAAGDSSGTITAAGLYAYVKDRVERWAQDNRAAQQTPVLLPADGRADRITLLAVGRGSYHEPAPAEAPGDDFKQAADLAASKVWEEHDRLRQASPSPAAYAPHLWRLYEATLLRYEQLVRADDQGNAQKLKGKLDDLRGALESAGRLELSSRSRTLAWRGLRGKGGGPAEEQAAAVLEKLRRAKPAERDAIWAAARQQAGNVEAEEALRLEIARQLLADVDRQRAEPDAVKAAHDLLLAVDGGGNDRPVEAHLLALLGRDLQERSKAGQKATPSDALRAGLDTCILAEQTALSAPEVRFREASTAVPAYSEFVYPWIAPTLQEADQARRDGENLLFAADEGSWQESRADFKKATAAYAAARDQAEGVRKALAVYHEARAWLPYYAHYLAGRAQTTPAELEAVEQLAHKVDDLAGRLETPGRDGQSLKAPAEEAYARLHDLQKPFDDRCAALAAEGPQPVQSRWRDLEDVLTVPSIPAATRLALLRQSRQVSRDLNRDTGKGTAPAALAADPLTEARRQGRMALAVLGEHWVGDCNEKAPDAFTGLQQQVTNGDADALAAAGPPIRECWERMAQAVKDASALAPEDQDPKAAEQDVRRAERLARQLDGGGAYLLFDVLKVPDPVAERRHLLLDDLLRELAGRALRDHWWGERDQTPYYVVSGKAYVRDARDQAPHQHPALAAERGKLLDGVDKQLVPAGLEVSPAVERLAVTDETNVAPKFLMKDLKAGPQVPRGAMVCWEETSGPGIRKGGGGRQVRGVGNETLPYPVKWSNGVPPAQECKVTLHVRYRGQELSPEVVIVPAGKPDLTVYHHPPANFGRVMVQADDKLYNDLAWEQMRIAIVFDRSYSMEHPDSGPSKLPEATDALSRVLDKLPPGPRVSVWTFGHRKFYGEEDPSDQLRAPKRWTRDQKEKLINQILGVTSLRDDAGSPIVRTMMKASEKDLGLKKRDSSEELPGAKLLLVLSDGEDNDFKLDKDYNPTGKADIPTFLKEQLGKSDIRVIVIGFRVEAKEQKNAQEQFEVVREFRQRGEFTLAEDKDQLLDALTTALKEQKLRCRIQARGQDNPLTASEDPGGDLLVHRYGQTLIPSKLLKPYTYLVSVPEVLPQDVRLRDGDQLLLQVKRTGQERALLERALLERALLKDYDEQRRKQLAQGLPHGHEQGWYVTVHGNPRPDDPRSLELLLSTEKDAGRSDPRGVLEQVRPGFVWFEAEPRESKAKPAALSWRNLGDVVGYPAPVWRLGAQGWPQDALPRVRAWVSDQDPGTVPRLSTGRPHGAGTEPQKLDAEELRVGTDRVTDLSVTFDTYEVEDTPGHKVAKPCLVVRATYPPKSPVMARIDGALKVQGAEHRYYSAANRYTGIFWSVTPDQARDAAFNLTLVSVKAVQDDPGTAKVQFNLEDADRDLPDLPPVGWGR
jgi:hypothetical protein